MKFLLIITLFIITSACSLNQNSKYWSEDNNKRVYNEIKLEKIIEKSNDIISMTYNEYQIFIDNHTKKSKHPEISN